MAIIDTTRDVVVVRIVYDGAPAAGKTLSVQTLGKLLGKTNARLHRFWIFFQHAGHFIQGVLIQSP